jgi:hypothetical protein
VDANIPATGGRRLEDLERLVNGMGGFLTQVATRVRQAANLVAGLAAGIGIVGLALGVWAWNDSVPVLVVVLVICVPAVLAPVFVVRRLKPVTEAVAHPDEAARQARDYFSGLHSSPELNELVREAASLQGAKGGIRLRNAVRGLRLTTSMMEAMAPDPVSQPLVAALRPSHLRAVWSAVVMAWVFGILASLVGIVAAAALAAEAIA